MKLQITKLILCALISATMIGCGPIREPGLITGQDAALTQDNLPLQGITFLDLVGNNNSRNVFRANCAACHSGNSPAAGLNLTDFEAAKGASAKILRRLRATSNQMPPRGALAESQIRQVEAWVAEGLR